MGAPSSQNARQPKSRRRGRPRSSPTSQSRQMSKGNHGAPLRLCRLMCRGGLPRGQLASSAWGYALRGRSSNSLQSGENAVLRFLLAREKKTSRRAQPNSVLGSYREASHRGTSGGTAVMNPAWCLIVVSKQGRPLFAECTPNLNLDGGGAHGGTPLPSFHTVSEARCYLIG